MTLFFSKSNDQRRLSTIYSYTFNISFKCINKICKPIATLNIFWSDRQATMLKKLKGKMKRRNTEPTMTAGANTTSQQMSLAAAVEPEEVSQNETDF